jgi:hypothetical protein
MRLNVGSQASGKSNVKTLNVRASPYKARSVLFCDDAMNRGTENKYCDRPTDEIYGKKKQFAFLCQKMGSST